MIALKHAIGYLRCALAISLVMLLVACGGRASNPISQESAIDFLLTCDNIDAERTANAKRVADLKDERKDNRLRSAGRVATSIFGNPFSAVALFDTSAAIYQEIGAIEARNERLTSLKGERGCEVEQAAPLERSPVIVWAEERRRVDTLGAYGDLGGTRPATSTPIAAAAEAE